MGWQIELLENSVKVSKKTAAALFKASLYEGADNSASWGGLDADSVLDNKSRLIFDYDHQEHMDYLSTYPEYVKILKKAKVKGRILFRSTEGDNAGCYWGHEFDGKSGYRSLVGTEVITWEPA